MDQNPSRSPGGRASLAWLGAGVGLLLAKAWGRTLSIGSAWYAMVSAVVGMIVNRAYVLQPMFAAMKAARGLAAMGAVGRVIGGLLGGLFALIHAIKLLIFMNRTALRATLTSREATP
jgi:hypothetical protein